MKLNIGRSEDFFSMRHFLLGLSVVLGLYTTLFLTLFALQNTTLGTLEKALAKQSLGLVVSDINPQAPAKDVTEKQPQKTETPPVPEGNPDEELRDILAASQEQALPESPLEGQTEDSPYGLLPIISREAKTPFNVYKRPYALNRNAPVLSVAVLDYGLSSSLSDSLVKELPPNVSLILNPYSAAPDEWQKKARKAGHEIWLQLMTLTHNFPQTDPGAQGLITNVTAEYNQSRLAWMLGRTTGYAGVAAFTDSTLKKSEPIFQTLAQDIFKRGLGYLELNPSRNAFWEPLAIEAGIPNAHNALFLDDLSPENPDLKKVEDLLHDQGGAFVTLKPTPSNIILLKTWLAALEAKGVHLAPVSAIAGVGAATE